MARFAAFIPGSFVAVLLATVIDHDLVIHLEIIPHFRLCWYSGHCAWHDPRSGHGVRLGSSYEGDRSLHTLLSGGVAGQDDVNSTR